MKEYNLTDEQWCFLDLMMRANRKGQATISRQEILHASLLPQAVAMRLTWAAITMPSELVQMIGQHEFKITDAGVSLYRLRFGQNAEPTTIADNVICLPGPTGIQN